LTFGKAYERGSKVMDLLYDHFDAKLPKLLNLSNVLIDKGLEIANGKNGIDSSFKNLAKVLDLSMIFFDISFAALNSSQSFIKTSIEKNVELSTKLSNISMSVIELGISATNLSAIEKGIKLSSSSFEKSLGLSDTIFTAVMSIIDKPGYLDGQIGSIVGNAEKLTGSVGTFIDAGASFANLPNTLITTLEKFQKTFEELVKLLGPILGNAVVKTVT
jgi:hypothetical protein